MWKNQEEAGKHDGTGATSAPCPPMSASSKRPASAAGADGQGTTPYHELRRFILTACNNERMREIARGERWD